MNSQKTRKTKPLQMRKLNFIKKYDNKFSLRYNLFETEQ